MRLPAKPAPHTPERRNSGSAGSSGMPNTTQIASAALHVHSQRADCATCSPQPAVGPTHRLRISASFATPCSTTETSAGLAGVPPCSLAGEICGRGRTREPQGAAGPGGAPGTCSHGGPPPRAAACQRSEADGAPLEARAARTREPPRKCPPQEHPPASRARDQSPRVDSEGQRSAPRQGAARSSRAGPS